MVNRDPAAASSTHYFPFPTHVGSLARGFICDEARLVVVTDAEIFGRYKVQRPRRLKSPHAAAMRSALEMILPNWNSAISWSTCSTASGVTSG
jgi:hypothetical protein